MHSSFSNKSETKSTNSPSKITKISVPIDIPNKNNNLNNDSHYNKTYYSEEYSLDYNIFNPGKGSPPDNWKSRLINRINKL